MFQRLLQLPEDESFFLFGPRATGKTTLLKSLPWFQRAIFIDLLKADAETSFERTPQQLEAIVKALPQQVTHVIIDEIQKVPKLLDIVHGLIENTDKKFVMTSSSARKLKHGGANLLAGRAFVYHLYPFTYLEIDPIFSLDDSLQWGLLPKIFEYTTSDKKRRYLEAYTQTYLKEEIWVEQFIRDLAPFRRFLEVSAQCNGEIVNFANIAQDVGVSDLIIQKYFSILEDTLIGFFLEAFQHSFRKRLSKKPKFYFFDTGVVRALSMQLSIPLATSTSAYGDLFEHFIILQCIQLAHYNHLEYRFSYLKTKDDAEIDLVVERPGKPILFIEIKSNQDVQPHHLTTFKKLALEFGHCEAVCFSRDNFAKLFESIKVLPWKQGIQEYFGQN